MNSCMGTCVALSIFCLNIALPCSPLNAFETWADQQELSKEAKYKSAFSTQRRVSLLESSMLLKNLMEARNQKICKGSWPHSLSTARFVVLFFTPRMCLKEIRCLFCNWLPNSLPSLRYTVPHTWLAYIPAGIPYTLDNQSIAWGLLLIRDSWQTQTSCSVHPSTQHFMQSACQISAYAHYARTPVLQLKQRTDDFFLFFFFLLPLCFLLSASFGSFVHLPTCMVLSTTIVISSQALLLDMFPYHP